MEQTSWGKELHLTDTYCAAVLSIGQNEGYFAEASLVWQAFGYSIE